MIRGFCACGQAFTLPESQAGKTVPCSKCNAPIQLAAGEALPDGAGEADFDARLIVASGPDRAGQHILLGGVADLHLGKASENQIVLPGNKVSRRHCHLVRVDFGPSQWEIRDDNSTNGVYVNGQKTAGQALQSGDEMWIGDYKLRYLVDAPTIVEPAAAASDSSAVGTSVIATLPRTMAGAALGLPASTGPLANAITKTLPNGLKALAAAPKPWLTQLKNAGKLLCVVIVFELLGRLLGDTDQFPTVEVIGLIGAAMNWAAAAWLGKPDPEAPGSGSDVVQMLLLNIFAGIAAAGSLIALAGWYTGHSDIGTFGKAIALAQVGLLVLILRQIARLAVRIPEPTLVTNARIAMIGLPVAILATYGLDVFKLLSPETSVPDLVTYGGDGLLLLFGIWYFSVVTWFRNSLP